MSIRQRSRGTWQVRVELPRDPLTGRRRRLEETVRGNKRQAEAVERELRVKAGKGDLSSAERLTVGEWLKRWRRDYLPTKVGPQTQQDYASIVNNRLIPMVGHLQLRALLPAHVKAIHASLLEAGRSPGTVRKIHYTLQGALQDAFENGLVNRNVCAMVHPPKYEKKEIAILPQDQLLDFLEGARTSPYGDLFLLGIATGLRRSELLGLRWPNVDLDQGRISVVENWQVVTQRGGMSLPPKSKKSRRTIGVPTDIVEMLSKRREDQEWCKAALGDQWQGRGHVFCHFDGRPYSPDTVSEHFTILRKRYGLPEGLTLHGLRHTYATYLLGKGVNIKTVSELLGHASVAFTLDTYTHVMPGWADEATEAISTMLSEGQKTVGGQTGVKGVEVARN